jgi:hypothetical protein
MGTKKFGSIQAIPEFQWSRHPLILMQVDLRSSKLRKAHKLRIALYASRIYFISALPSGAYFDSAGITYHFTGWFTAVGGDGSLFYASAVSNSSNAITTSFFGTHFDASAIAKSYCAILLSSGLALDRIRSLQSRNEKTDKDHVES